MVNLVLKIVKINVFIYLAANQMQHCKNPEEKRNKLPGVFFTDTGILEPLPLSFIKDATRWQ